MAMVANKIRNRKKASFSSEDRKLKRKEKVLANRRRMDAKKKRQRRNKRGLN